MLGSPLLRAAIAVAALLLLLAPLRFFTAPRGAVAVVAPTPVPASEAHLEIISTKASFSYAVEYLGKVIWQGDSAGPSVAADLPLPIPKEGIDLALKVSWKNPGTAAVKLVLTHDDNDPVERTIWGDASASDVLTFP